MEHATLSELIDRLEKGTSMHICVAFLDNCGNRKTRCTGSQTIHNQPVCLAVKGLPHGLASCYRCRNTVQRAVVRSRRSMAGVCSNGVYEYCRPVVYDDRVICVVFIGNILTGASIQRKRLAERVDSSLLKTMEQHFTPEDCAKTADILESYINFLFDRYGIENKTFDPLIENIKNYIRENMLYDFSIAELAAAFNYTPKYLGRIFKSRTGQSISHYCNRVKTEYAKHLLTQSDSNIENIALQSGFNSVNYFDRVFHRMTGLSPQAYRSTATK